jgi:MFS family permease
MIKSKKWYGDFYGWKMVVILFIGYFLFMGLPQYTGSVINSYLLKDISMSRATYGLGFTILTMMVCICAFPVAFSISKFGTRKTIFTGGAVLLCGLLWLAFIATKPWQYIVGFGILVGIGMGVTCVIPSTTTVIRWHNARRGLAMAIVLMASSIGGFVGSPMANAFLENGGGWRVAELIIAVGVALALLLYFFTFVEKPEDIGQIPDGKVYDVPKGNPELTTFEWTLGEVVKTPVFWVLFFGVVACKIPFFFWTGHGILHVKDMGLNAAQAAIVMSCYSIGGVPGRLIAGPLLDRMKARYVFILGILWYIIGYALMFNISGKTAAVAYFGALCIGMGFGWTFVSMNTLPSIYFGKKAFAKVNGIMTLCAGLFSSPISVLGGAIYDKSGNYFPAFWMLIGLCVLGCIMLMFAKVPKKPECSTKVASA